MLPSWSPAIYLSMISCSDREIQFYELSSLEPYCQITALETVPLTLDYWWAKWINDKTFTYRNTKCGIYVVCVPQCHWLWQMLHSLWRHPGKIFIISDLAINKQQATHLWLCVSVSFRVVLLSFYSPLLETPSGKSTFLQTDPAYTFASQTLLPCILWREREERDTADASGCNELRRLIAWCCLSARLSCTLPIYVLRPHLGLQMKLFCGCCVFRMSAVHEKQKCPKTWLFNLKWQQLFK